MELIPHDRFCEVDESAGVYACGCSQRMDDAYDREMEARVDREKDRRRE